MMEKQVVVFHYWAGKTVLDIFEANIGANSGKRSATGVS